MPPNFLAVVFKKQAISQQVVTRMQDLASEFSKIFQGDTPNPHSERRRPPPAPNTQSGLWPGAERKRPGVVTQTLVSPSPSTFQPCLRRWGCEELEGVVNQNMLVFTISSHGLASRGPVCTASCQTECAAWQYLVHAA